MRLPPVRTQLALACALRLALVAWGLHVDASQPHAPYTDVDYSVFTDAAAALAAGGSPYERDTYVYIALARSRSRARSRSHARTHAGARTHANGSAYKLTLGAHNARAHGHRHTDAHTRRYRYPPLLAAMLLPNALGAPHWGKALFCAADAAVGWVLADITRTRGAGERAAVRARKGAGERACVHTHAQHTRADYAH